MRYENETHLEREKRAIEKFTSMFNLTYKKLGHHDIDFQVLKLKGSIEEGGRPPRPESTNDQELMAYYTSQKHLHHEEY